MQLEKSTYQKTTIKRFAVQCWHSLMDQPAPQPSILRLCPFRFPVGRDFSPLLSLTTFELQGLLLKGLSFSLTEGNILLPMSEQQLWILSIERASSPVSDFWMVQGLKAFRKSKKWNHLDFLFTEDLIRLPLFEVYGSVSSLINLTDATLDVS